MIGVHHDGPTSAKTIRAIRIQPGTSGCVDDIEDTLPAFRRIVGGYIEQVSSEDLQHALG